MLFRSTKNYQQIFCLATNAVVAIFSINCSIGFLPVRNLPQELTPAKCGRFFSPQSPFSVVSACRRFFHFFEFESYGKNFSGELFRGGLLLFRNARRPDFANVRWLSRPKPNAAARHSTCSTPTCIATLSTKLHIQKTVSASAQPAFGFGGLSRFNLESKILFINLTPNK